MLHQLRQSIDGGMIRESYVELCSLSGCYALQIASDVQEAELHTWKG